MKRHCHTPAIRAAPGQIFADTQTLPRSLLTCTPTGLLIILVVWKSLGADKKGSAALHTKTILPNAQQLALMTGYFPTCTKLPFRVNSSHLHWFHFAAYKAPRLHNSPSELLHSLVNVYVMYMEFGCLPWR